MINIHIEISLLNNIFVRVDNRIKVCFWYRTFQSLRTF